MTGTKFDNWDALRWYTAMGVDYIIEEKCAVPQSPQNRGSIAKRKAYSSTLPSVLLARKLADKVTTIEELQEAVYNFEGNDLKKFATNTVFADGIFKSAAMLVGEAPGASEDARGIPFCGKSGELLDNMLKSIELYRKKNVYITNTVFWRPPANRQPTTEEVEICRPFVEKHIALSSPKLLILVGSTASTSLLGKHLQISKIRQIYYQYNNCYLTNPIPTTAIFRPAYLLRQPSQKRASWHDLLKIQDFLRKNSNHH